MPFWEEELAVRMNTTFLGGIRLGPEQWMHIPQRVQTQG